MDRPDFDLENIGITPDAISEDAKKAIDDDTGESFFITKPACDWVDEEAKREMPKKLCGDLWYEGETCILFSDTNLGKSIFAVQIADALTKGKDIGIIEE
jgi:RecA-family ATPase